MAVHCPAIDTPKLMHRIAEYIQWCQKDELNEVSVQGKSIFEVDLDALARYDDDLYNDFRDEPEVIARYIQETLRTWKETTEEASKDDSLDVRPSKYHEENISEDIKIRTKNAPRDMEIPLGQPDPDDYGNLVAVTGVVRQVSAPCAITLESVFECQLCGSDISVPVLNGELQEPHKCDGCERQGPFKRLINREKRDAYQELIIQEEPGDAINTSNPRELRVKVHGADLRDTCQPGDRVTITGILEEEFDDPTDVLVRVSLKAADIETEESDFEAIEITDEDKDTIEEISERHDLFELLAESLAPGIYGHKTAKKALILQAFGGVTRFEDDLDRETIRGNINLLLIGDPSTGKTELAEGAARIAPRSVKAVGNGTTAAGITASAVEKKIAGSTQWTLQAGALVLGDKGLCVIDELDKTKESVQKSLHEALESGTITINKADFANVKLKARTSAVMIANPVYGQFDPYETFPDQFGLDKALLSRADLVLTFLDKPDSDQDGKIARRNLVNRWGSDNSDSINAEAVIADGSIVDDNGLLSPDISRKYIAYARRDYRPTGSQAIIQKLERFYTTIREMSSEKGVSIRVRSLDGLARMAEAHAKMRLSNTIKMKDVDAVINLFMAAYNQAGRDEGESQFNAGIWDGEKGQTKREHQKRVIHEAIDELAPKHGDRADGDEVLDVAMEKCAGEHEREELEHVLETMSKMGEVNRVGSEYFAG